MALLRGLQSVIFYYVSCAPCTKYTARKKRKKQIARDIKDRDALDLETPDVYRQPLAYRTNEYWADEIRSGPGPPARNIKKKERENRRQAVGIQEMERIAGVGIVKESANPPPKPPAKALESITSDNILSVDGMKTMLRQALPAPERWRRNQREDEDLWGSPSLESLPDSRKEPIRQGSGGGSSVGFPGLAHPQASTESFYTGRNPPINDLHPPVVSNPSVNRAGNKWMLQPPPKSGVMNGYVSPGAENNRSRSGSGGSASSWKRGGDVRLDRQISQKLIEEKLSRGELIPSPSSPSRSFQQEKFMATSPKKQSSEESGSTVVRTSTSRLDPASSSSSAVIPGTSDSGVDVTLPMQTWSTPAHHVPGTSHQDFAFSRKVTPTKGVDRTRQITLPMSGGKEKFYTIPAPSSRPLRSSTVDLAEPAPVHFADSQRGTVSASTSPVKTRQYRVNPAISQRVSTPPKHQRRRDFSSTASPMLPLTQAETGTEKKQDRPRTKPRRRIDIIPANGTDSDDGADADTEDEDGYVSPDDIEIRSGSIARASTFHDRDKRPHTRNRNVGRRGANGDTAATANVEDVAVAGNTGRSRRRRQQRHRTIDGEDENDLHGNNDEDDDEEEKGDGDLGKTRAGQALLLRRWSVDF